MTQNIGATFNQEVNTGEFTSSVSLSWVKGSHAYKFGGNMHTRMEGFGNARGAGEPIPSPPPRRGSPSAPAG